MLCNVSCQFVQRVEVVDPLFVDKYVLLLEDVDICQHVLLVIDMRH